MTKARTPDSFADATTKVMGLLGVPEAARVASAGLARPVNDRTVYHWANPDSDRLPSLYQALALDAAYQLAGGEGAPFRDAYDHQLGIQIERQDACRRKLATDAIELIHETADVHASLFAATQPGASPRDFHRALVEVQQLDGVLRRIRRRLPRFLHLGAGPRSGMSGGSHEG